MKEYAKTIRQLHTTTGLPTGPNKVQKDTPEAERRAAKEKRDKAKEYLT